MAAQDTGREGPNDLEIAHIVLVDVLERRVAGIGVVARLHDPVGGILAEFGQGVVSPAPELRASSIVEAAAAFVMDFSTDSSQSKHQQAKRGRGTARSTSQCLLGTVSGSVSRPPIGVLVGTVKVRPTEAFEICRRSQHRQP